MYHFERGKVKMKALVGLPVCVMMALSLDLVLHRQPMVFRPINIPRLPSRGLNASSS